MKRSRAGRPRLLVVVGTFAHMGGAERQALYLVRYLNEIGADVEVLAFQDGPVIRSELESMGIRGRYFPYYFRWPKAKRARSMASLVHLLRRDIRPDALLPFVGIHSKTMALAWPYTNARFCWWNQQDEGRDLTGTPVESRVLRRVSTITSNSYEGRDFLARTYALDPDLIHVYNNGTPIPEIEAPRGEWRRREQLGERMVVTMLANISTFKDHDTLIEAWPLVKRSLTSGNQPVLLLAGTMADTATSTRLKLKAFELGLSTDDVRFLGPVENIQPLLADSDLVVHSSITEGCPNSVCEAMAASKAVVATDISGTRQALGSDSAQWLAKPRDPADLASKIVTLLENESLRNQVGEKNRERISSEFSIDGMNRFFRNEIEEGLGASIT